MPEKILKPFLSGGEAAKIPIGCCIDDILDGGIETKIITQVYGPSGSGKTNLCLQIAVNVVRAGKKVIFIDTEGGRSVDRLKQIAGKDFKAVLDNSYFYEPSTFDDQNFIIENLDKVINEEFGLVVVDCAVSLYRIGTDEEKATSMNRMLSKQLAKLGELARKYNLVAIITNQVYSSFEDGGVEPIGGSILKYWSKAVIELKKEDFNKREAILRRHRSLPEDISVKFVITNGGLRDAR
ncbi:MAG: DNA repair and recombination protein RadB [Candidatus Hydrothermarchaeota archaeon]|nr:DNA repair and recombination protein RadB [Candidatus Hydrothermarchaeota archaeon]